MAEIDEFVWSALTLAFFRQDEPTTVDRRIIRSQLDRIGARVSLQ